MKTYEIEVCGIKRQLPLIKMNDSLSFGSFVIIGDTELISACAGPLAEKIGPVDAIVTAEAKGIALAYEVSRKLNLKEFIVARKSVKNYMQDVVSHEVNSITTSGTQKLYLDGIDAAKIKGKNVCILDDVISTGESLRAMEELVTEAGGIIVGKMAVLAEGDAADRDDIITLAPLPLFNPDGTVKA